MARKKEDLLQLEIFDEQIANQKIVYPLCLKTKDDRKYFRYLEDGGYEMIERNNFNQTLSVGIYKHTIKEIIDEDNFYFKVLMLRNVVISNEEFDSIKNELIKNYTDYLNRENYIGSEIKQLIEEERMKESQGIISKHKDYEEDPF